MWRTSPPSLNRRFILGIASQRLPAITEQTQPSSEGVDQKCELSARSLNPALSTKTGGIFPTVRLFLPLENRKAQRRYGTDELPTRSFQGNRAVCPDTLCFQRYGAGHQCSAGQPLGFGEAETDPVRRSPPGQFTRTFAILQTAHCQLEQWWLVLRLQFRSHRSFPSTDRLMTT